MASTDARPLPLLNNAYRITFDILDADGDPVIGAAGLDSEKSLDGAAFSDCTNEATEIGNGLYYLDLTAAEMNADTVAIVIKTSTSGAKQTNLVIYPKALGDMDMSLESGAISDSKIAGSAITDAKIATGALTAAKFAAGAIDAAAIADNAIDAGAIAANALTDAKINTGAFTSAKFAAGAISATVFSQGAADLVWGSAARTLTSFGTLIADIWAYATRTLSGFGTLVSDIWTAGTRSLTDKAGFTISGTKTTLDALNDITAANVWAAVTRTLTAAVDINSNADITAIKAKTDLITGAPALETTAQSIKAKTDLITGAPALETTAQAIKTKTDSLTFTLAGKIDSNILAIQGQLTSGNNATLNLKTLNIQNNAGSAIVAKSTGGGVSDDWHGLDLAGSGRGMGAKINGGDSARCGAQINGGQIGMEITNAMNISKVAIASDYAGFLIQGLGTYKPGIIISGTATGIEISATGDDPEHGSAISLKASGMGSGLYSRGGASGYGIDSNIHGNLDGSVNSVSTAVNINSNADITAIKNKTNNLPASPANEVTSAAIKAKTDLIPASPANETTSAAIKAKTDLIPASPATEGTATAIKAKTDSLPGDPTSETIATSNKNLILAAIGSIPSGISKADVAAALVDQDISAVPVNAGSIYRLMLKFKTVLLNPIRWDFTGIIAKILYKNDAGTVTEAEAPIYKDNGSTKPLNSGQVSTRDKVTFS